jgi:hypothetical protein
MKEFKKYLKQAREEFAYEVSKYNVEDNLALRTASDSLLIAFDQATEKAINYTHCCTELPTKEDDTEYWVDLVNWESGGIEEVSNTNLIEFKKDIDLEIQRRLKK